MIQQIPVTIERAFVAVITTHETWTLPTSEPEDVQGVLEGILAVTSSFATSSKPRQPADTIYDVTEDEISDAGVASPHESGVRAVPWSDTDHDHLTVDMPTRVMEPEPVFPLVRRRGPARIAPQRVVPRPGQKDAA